MDRRTIEQERRQNRRTRAWQELKGQGHLKVMSRWEESLEQGQSELKPVFLSSLLQVRFGEYFMQAYLRTSKQ